MSSSPTSAAQAAAVGLPSTIRGLSVEKEVYESSPDVGVGTDVTGGSSDYARAGVRRGGLQGVGKAEELQSEQHSAEAAYEFFKNREYAAGEGGEGVVQPVNTALRHVTRQEYVLEGLPAMGSTGGASGAVKTSEKEARFETPMQRLGRLQNEVSEMQQFVEKFLENRGAKAVADKEAAQRMEEEAKRYFNADPESLVEELATLRRLVDGVLADDRLQQGKASTEVTTAKSAASTFDLVCRHIDSVTKAKLATPTDGKKTPTAAGGGKGGGEFSYELYCVPSLKPLVESSRLGLLEKRLAEMEELLGVHKGAQLVLPFSDLFSGMQDIANRLLLLDPSRVENLSKRVQNLSAEMDSLLQRRERYLALQQHAAQQVQPGTPLGMSSPMSGSVESALDDNRVKELYDLCAKWKSTTGCLPVVIKRLKTLKCLHQDSAAVATRLNALESQQAELAKLLEESQQQFSTLKTSVSESLTWAKTVLTELQRDVDAMKSKK